MGEHVQHGALDVRSLDLDVQVRGIADQRQHLGERRHALAVSGVERLQPRQWHLVDITGAIGRAADVSIVNDDRDTVRRRVDVELDAVDADSERVPERAQRVLRVNRGGSPVGIDQVICLRYRLYGAGRSIRSDPRATACRDDLSRRDRSQGDGVDCTVAVKQATRTPATWPDPEKP